MQINHCGKPFSDSIQDQINICLTHAGSKKYAAFDADGTLWDNDLGEQFFNYQIENCNLQSLKGVDAWGYYHKVKKTDPIAAYLWLAQINSGIDISTVKQWAKKALESKTLNLFTPQKQLIKSLKESGFEVFIVTASIKWAVEPAAHLLGLTPENVLGIQTSYPDGIVTADQMGPITWRKGKAEALLKKTNGTRPLLCSGNTFGDIALLEEASNLQICIQTQTQTNSLFEEELKLREHAQGVPWPIHKMI